MRGILKLVMLVHLLALGTTNTVVNESSNGIQEVVQQLIEKVNGQEKTMKRQDSLIESLKGEIVRLKNNVTENQVKQQADIQQNMNQIKMMKEQASESSW